MGLIALTTTLVAAPLRRLAKLLTVVRRGEQSEVATTLLVKESRRGRRDHRA
jgi:hypothetical protein